MPIKIEKRKPKKDRDYESDTPSASDSSINQSDLVSESLDSDEGVDDMENVHGFVYGHHLDTYKKSKKERTVAMVKERENNRDDRRDMHRKRDRKLKGISTTNIVKTKNKAFNMLLPKRVVERFNRNSEMLGKLKKRDKNAVGQLGHMHKTTKQKINAKKKVLQFGNRGGQGK